MAPAPLLGNVDLDRMRIVLPPMAKHFPNNPIRPRSPASSTLADERVLLQSSNGDSSFAERNELATERSLLRTLLQLTARDFVTGSSRPDLEPTRLLDPLRRPMRHQSRRAFKAMRVAVEHWLTGLGFNRGETFELDGLCNLLLLRSDHHRFLDEFGVIAFTPPFTLLLDLLSQLMQDNAEWEKRHSADPAAKRNLDHTVYDSAEIEWYVLALHPEEFDNDKEPTYALKRELRTFTPVSSDDAWVRCRAFPHPHFGTHMLYEGDTPLALRSQYPLSLFAVITNLESKIAAVVSHAADDSASPATSDLAFLHLLLKKLVAEIFFAPADWAPALAVKAAVADSLLLESADPAGAAPRQTQTPPPDAAAGQHASAPPEVSQNPSQPVSSEDVAAWAASVPSSSASGSLVIDHNDHHSGDESIEDVDEEQDTDSDEETDEVVRGVTESEYVTLLQRIADPPAEGQSRADDVRMLFFGAGYERPMSLASLRREEAARDASRREDDS